MTHPFLENQVFQRSVAISMGTNCAPLLADLFLYSYGTQTLVREKKYITRCGL